MDIGERAVIFAEERQSVFRLGCNDYNASLLHFWAENGMLPSGARVIDIGCGVGKYGTYLAEMGYDVTLVDISGEMLRRAENNMAPYHTPWKIFQCDFREVPVSEPVFAGGFDLAISTMSPAVCDVETVRKMSSITHGWCFIARFSKWHQPFRDRLMTELGEEPLQLHGDSERDCSSMIRFIKEAGYIPQVRFVDYSWADARTPEQMSRYMLDRYYPDSDGRDDLYSRLLQITGKHAGEDGTVNDAVNTEVAWIWWSPNDTV